jgi:mRNA interferase MazF
MPKQGDILLILVPFTDLSSGKKRPVIVISNSAHNRKSKDIVVVAMTSNPAAADYSFTLTQADMAQGKLNRPGKVRIDRVFTLSQSDIIKTFGRVKPTVLNRIRVLMQELLSEKP